MSAVDDPDDKDGLLLESGLLEPPPPDDDVLVCFEVRACPSGIARLSMLIVPVLAGGPTTMSLEGWRYCHGRLDDKLAQWNQSIVRGAVRRVARGGSTRSGG